MALPQHGHWISNQQVIPEGRSFLSVLDPESDQPFAEFVRGTEADIRNAVAAAHEAFRVVSATGPGERESWLIRVAALLESQADEFVDLLIRETGSPISKARREIASSLSMLRAAVGVPRQIRGNTFPSDVGGRISMSIRRPLGVIAGITPFNVPLIKGIKHTALPVATGNTVVLLPSVDAPLTALRIAKLYADAGLPTGSVNVVTGRGDEIGDILTGSPDVRMVGFTGSTKVGRHVARQCAKTGKRVTLEMGGRNPLIVLSDADLPSAVRGAVLSSFLYQGQICMASSRVYVERSIYDGFLKMFVAGAQALGAGDLLDPKTMIGPIINSRQRDRIRGHLADAVQKGAVTECGGKWVGNRLMPTVFTSVPADALIRTEETFGPVTFVQVVDSWQEALDHANESSFGLCGAVYTASVSRAREFGERMECGMLHVNSGTIQEEPHIPFGGVGDSGFGREGTDAAIQDMTELKWITTQ